MPSAPLWNADRHAEGPVELFDPVCAFNFYTATSNNSFDAGKLHQIFNSKNAAASDSGRRGKKRFMENGIMSSSDFVLGVLLMDGVICFSATDFFELM